MKKLRGGTQKSAEHLLICPDCKRLMHLAQTDYGMAYLCSAYPECRSLHKAHDDGTPVGVPGDKATRQARMLAHGRFDELWKTNRMTRDQAYMLLARLMDKKPEDAHIALFDKDECQELIRRLDLLGE